MIETEIIYPVFVQVLLTFILFGWMAVLRFREVKSGTVKVRDVADRTVTWSDKSTRVELAFYNQFQVPVLFYAACAFTAIYHQLGPVMIVLSWVFIASRAVQIYAHTVPNNVNLRANSYFVGFLVVLGMWGYLVFVLTSNMR